MAKQVNDFEIRVIKTPIPKDCVCPICGAKQPFKKSREHWKKVKDLCLDKPTLLSVQRISAKCLNPACKRKSFVIPVAGIEKYQRAATRVKDEALNKNILDNMPYQRTASSLKRLNTTGSKSSLDRWKREEASKYNFKDIISKLNFSGILSLDEYKPKKARRYDLLAVDTVRWHILYLETVPLSPRRAGSIGRGSIEQFCWRLKGLGINPRVIIFDLLAAYPKQVKKVWPEVIIQYDHFHVMQQIHKYLKNALLQFRRQLKGEELEPFRQELWKRKWQILKNMDRWTAKDHKLLFELRETYEGTLVEDILVFKEQLYQIFDNSSSQEEAYTKRDSLYLETWWQSSWHLRKAMEFLMSSKFDYMITYLADSHIPRSGNIENLIAIWRQMEKARRGFKTEQGRQNHLKLYQIKHYLSNQVAEKVGKSTTI